VLTLLTARVAYQSSFINGQTAREFLVYAHATEADKKVFDEIEDLSFRLTRGRDLVVAYSGDGLYPYWWYLRNYPNKKYFLTSPTRELRDADVIIAGRDVMNKMGPIVGERFLKFSYIRLWWPMQAYTNLTWDRVRDAVTDPQMRQALWDIWFNRDYTRYAAATGQPSDPMDVYINKDIAAKVWSYGSVPALVSESKPDPYEEKVVQVQANRIIGDTGSEPGMFNAPRGVALAADGSFYVADSPLGQLCRSLQRRCPRRYFLRALGRGGREKRQRLRHRHLEPSHPAIQTRWHLCQHVGVFRPGGTA